VLPTFHIVGDAFVDFFCYLEGDWPEQGGDAQLLQPVKAYAGGSSVNTATHLTSLLRSTTSAVAPSGGPPSVVLQTVLNPEDHYGKILLDHVYHHGLHLVNCLERPAETVDGNPKLALPASAASTGHCVAIVSRGERSFMTHRGCVEAFTACHLDLEFMIVGKRPAGDDDHDGHYANEEDGDNGDDVLHVHVAGYFNMPGFWHGKLRSVLERLRRERFRRRTRRCQQRRDSFDERPSSAAVTVSLVTQHDSTNQWDGGIDELVPLIDFFVMNELEANRILRRSRCSGVSPSGVGDDLPQQDQEEVDPVDAWVDHFSSLSPTTHFVVTRGAEGAVCFRAGKRIATLHPAIAVRVIDPTGAGDSFTAGFLHGIWSWRRQNDTQSSFDDGDDNVWPAEAIKQGLLWGCAVGTSAVTIRGASVPSRLENILDLYEKQKAKETFVNG
jgi:sugar/nucleoside kinase (ribokinase family)